MAMEHVRTGGMNCFRASQEYGIPYRTLKRRLVKKDERKHGMGPQSKQILLIIMFSLIMEQMRIISNCNIYSPKN